jgi:hypothetical protein
LMVPHNLLNTFMGTVHVVPLRWLAFDPLQWFSSSAHSNQYQFS